MTVIKDLLFELIGSYQLFSDATGFAAVDWPWILSALLLLVCVWASFGLIRKFLEVLF